MAQYTTCIRALLKDTLLAELDVHSLCICFVVPWPTLYLKMGDRDPSSLQSCLSRTSRIGLHSVTVFFLQSLTLSVQRLLGLSSAFLMLMRPI